MTTTLNLKALAFREYVEKAFLAASTAFHADPSGHNWHDLKVAMWAWQHVQGMKDDLPDAAHEHLRAIAARAKGDDDFSEA